MGSDHRDKPEQEPRRTEAPKATDDSVGAALGDLARSLAYSGLQKPTTGVVEAYDRLTGSQATSSAQFINQPEKVEPYSLRWHAQTVGNAVGSLIPFAAAYLTVGRFGGGIAADGARTGLLPELVGGSHSGLALTRAATSGFLVEGLNPVGINTENYWTTRLQHATDGAIVMGAMSGAGMALRYGSQFVGAGGISSVLRSQAGSNALGGVLTSPVAAELSALHDGRHATGSEILQAGYTMGLTGLTLAPLAKLSSGTASEAHERAEINALVANTKAKAQQVWQSTIDGGRNIAAQADNALWQINPLRMDAQPAYAVAAQGMRQLSTAYQPETVMLSARLPNRTGGAIPEGKSRQFSDEPAPERTHKLEDVLRTDDGLEAHAQAFDLLKAEFPSDFKGLRSAQTEPMAHGGDSLVIDLAPNKFRDESGAHYERAVLKIMKAPDRADPQSGWTTPEWNSEWGYRSIDMPLVRLANSNATTAPKEIAFGGDRYYAFMQPKGQSFGGGRGAHNEAFAEAGADKLLHDSEYAAWEKRFKADGFKWLDESPGQVVKYEMFEPNPADPKGAPVRVAKFGLIDYPSVTSKQSRSNAAGSSRGFEAVDEEGMTESQRLDEAGLHVLETPTGDPQWLQVAGDIREYKESKVPRKEIVEVVRILHQDYLTAQGLTAEQAVDAALRQR